MVENFPDMEEATGSTHQHCQRKRVNIVMMSCISLGVVFLGFLLSRDFVFTK